MHPVILDFGAFKLHSYGLMVFLAFAAGVWLGTVRGRKAGLPDGLVMDLAVWIMVSSLLGARLTYVAAHWGDFRGHWLDALSPFQSDGSIGIAGLVILGGVAAALPTAYWYLRRKGLSFLLTLDVLVPSLAFGIALGRIGCYLNGCCFGFPTALPWGVQFPASCYAGHVYPHLHIHPTQLYEMLYCIAIGLFLLWRTAGRRYTGELFHWFALLYGAARVWDESLRYYSPAVVPWMIGHARISGSMVASLLMALWGAGMLVRNWNRPAKH